MTISLKPQTQKLLEETLKTGHYESADEVVRAALQALKDLESTGLDQQTLNAIDHAEEQIDRGEVHAWKDVRDQVRAKFLGK